jgi:CRP-like cAMP-binding protein
MDRPDTKRDSLVAFSAGSFIFRQGERLDSAFYIKEGSVELFYLAEDGTPLITETVGNEAIIGIAAAFYGIPSPLSAKTIGITEVRRIPRTALEKMITAPRDRTPTPVDEDPAMAEVHRRQEQIRTSLSQRLIVESWTVQRALMKLDERYATLLREKDKLGGDVRRLTGERERFEKENISLRQRVSTTAAPPSGVVTAQLAHESTGTVIEADLDRALGGIDREPKTDPNGARERIGTDIGIVTPTHGQPTVKG